MNTHPSPKSKNIERNKIILLSIITGTSLLTLLFIPPIPQDPSYHSFADTKTLFNVSNFWNVFSNFPFLIFGLAGIYYLFNSGGFRKENLGFFFFFLGAVFTCFGSAYYHLAPDNHTLLWDRLPMTIAFTGLLAAIFGERMNSKLGYQLLPLFLVIGILTVIYWYYTEIQGAGDLRPYAFVQFYPIILIPVLIASYKKTYSVRWELAGIIFFYSLAKIFEHYDEQFMSLFGNISGHSLKHIFASFSVAMVIFYYKKTILKQRI